MLEARQLTKEYRSGDHTLAVLRDVSFTIPDGAFVAVTVTVLPDQTVAPLPGAQPHLDRMQEPGLAAGFSHKFPRK